MGQQELMGEITAALESFDELPKAIIRGLAYH
jgi:hypothetical protein